VANQSLTLVREVSSDCQLTDQENYVLNSNDLSQVKGKVAVIQGSNCKFTNYYDYLLDYRFRTSEVVKKGAIGVIFAEWHPGKLAEHLFDQETIPACVLEARDYTRLLEEPAWQGQAGTLDSLEADFTRTFLYTETDDVYNIPVPALTSIKVPEAWYDGSPAGLKHSIPAMSTTFNPTQVPQTTGKLVEVVWQESCETADYFSNCTVCWGEASPFKNSAELVGSVAFMNYAEGIPYCYYSYWQWAVLVQRAGGTGLVTGVSAQNNFYAIPSTYLLADLVTISTYKVPHVYAETLQSMIGEADSQGVTIVLPSVVDGAAPSYMGEATTQSALEFTVIGVWEQQQAGNWKSFYCDAGQATYNPFTHPGIAPPEFVDNGNVGLVTHAFPVDSCMHLDQCVECLKSGEGVNSTRLAADRLTAADSVMLLDLQDWVCHASYHHLTESVAEEGASAVIVVNGRDILNRDILYTMAPSGSEDQYRSPIPSFNIPRSCGLRIEQGSSFHVSLPKLVNGSAMRDEVHLSYYGELGDTQIMESTVLMTSVDTTMYTDACTECTVGQAVYNPTTAPSVESSLLAAKPAAACLGNRECLECDRTEDLFVAQADGSKLTTESLQGKIVFIDMAALYCLFPLSNVLWWMQGMGAGAVVFINTDDDVNTIAQAVVPFNPTIPAFSIGKSKGLSLVNAALKDPAMLVRSPRIVQGSAVYNPVLEPALGRQEALTIDDITGRNPEASNDGSKSKDDDNLGLIIGISVVGVVTLILLVVALAWFFKRQRALAAYNQFDMGCQTGDAFLDLFQADDNTCETVADHNTTTRVVAFEILRDV